MVAERGFEPPTPWSRTNNRCTNPLFRLGFVLRVVPSFCMVFGNEWTQVGPKQIGIGPGYAFGPSNLPHSGASKTEKVALAIRHISRKPVRQLAKDIAHLTGSASALTCWQQLTMNLVL
jgi:hypothetical protein